ELIIQINSVIKPLLKPNQKSLALYGGILSSEKHSTWSITSRLKKEKIDVIVSTSTRLIDFIKSKSLSLDDITILIFDEIDRLTNKQFRDSVCAVEGLVNADAVRVGVSATNGGEDVVRRWLNVDYKVVVFPEKVKRSVEEFIVNNLIQEGAKLKWLKHTLTSLVRVGGVIVFCGRRVTCEKVGDSVKLYLECKTLHGDVQQSVREDNLKAFRKGETKVLIATDVLGRGVDVKGVYAVVNYDEPKDWREYTHKVGRVGRLAEGGVEEGVCFTICGEGEIKREVLKRGGKELNV
ncbi:hypothetical protein TrLO_g15646, partial [Triparma laevis f. longispina]